MDMESKGVKVYDKDSHIAELEAINQALSHHLVELKKKAHKQHNEMSKKWRDKCFYYKRMYRMCRLEKENSPE